jgi:HSP20 family molecular chaperone IbpA
MKESTISNAKLAIYPGNYVPKYDAEDLKMELSQMGKKIIYPVKVKERKDFYQLQIVIPGANRDDFLIHTDNDVLSICMLHKDVEQFDGENFSVNNSTCNWFSKKLLLPDDTDAFFISAEYKSGILYVVLPKTQKQDKNVHTTIVVY